MQAVAVHSEADVVANRNPRIGRDDDACATFRCIVDTDMHERCRTEVSDTTGRVEILEPLGPTTVVHVRIDDAPATRARIVVPANARIAIGDHVGFRVRRDCLHFFDEKSGQRLDVSS